ncbi:MAG: hypothetical protein MHMPM18_000472 [Marteilia pararefringens]
MNKSGELTTVTLDTKMPHSSRIIAIKTFDGDKYFATLSKDSFIFVFEFESKTEMIPRFNIQTKILNPTNFAIMLDDENYLGLLISNKSLEFEKIKVKKSIEGQPDDRDTYIIDDFQSVKFNLSSSDNKCDEYGEQRLITLSNEFIAHFGCLLGQDIYIFRASGIEQSQLENPMIILNLEDCVEFDNNKYFEQNKFKILNISSIEIIDKDLWIEIYLENGTLLKLCIEKRNFEHELNCRITKEMIKFSNTENLNKESLQYCIRNGNNMLFKVKNINLLFGNVINNKNCEMNIEYIQNIPQKDCINEFKDIMLLESMLQKKRLECLREKYETEKSQMIKDLEKLEAEFDEFVEENNHGLQQDFIKRIIISNEIDRDINLNNSRMEKDKFLKINESKEFLKSKLDNINHGELCGTKEACFFIRGFDNPKVLRSFDIDKSKTERLTPENYENKINGKYQNPNFDGTQTNASNNLEEEIRKLKQSSGYHCLKSEIISNNQSESEFKAKVRFVNLSIAKESLKVYSLQIIAIKNAINKKMLDLRDYKLRIQEFLQLFNENANNSDNIPFNFKICLDEIIDLLASNRDSLKSEFEEIFLSVNPKYISDRTVVKLIKIINSKQTHSNSSRIRKLHRLFSVLQSFKKGSNEFMDLLVDIRQKVEFFIKDFDDKIDQVFTERCETVVEMERLKSFMNHIEFEIFLLKNYEKRNRELNCEFAERSSIVRNIKKVVENNEDELNQTNQCLMQLRSQLVHLNQEVDGLLATQSSQYTQYLLQLYKLDPSKSKENRKLHQLNSQMRIRISAKSPHSGANQIALAEKLIDFEEQVNNVADRDDSSRFLSMIQSGLRDANCLPNRQQQDNGLMQSICPSGCNLETYNKILELREDRIEIEKNIKSKSERAEVLEIQLNSSKSAMQRESDNLETIERQISEFEIEKLKELNKLFISCVVDKNDYQK